MPHEFSSIEEVLADMRAGRMIVLVDDEYRENEGDLVLAADKVTPEAINFMVRNGCGIFGLSLAPEICNRLNLEPVPGKNVDARRRRGRRTWTRGPALPRAPRHSIGRAPFRS